MYFSDDLRIKIAKKYSLNLEGYVWDYELNNHLMGIKLNFMEDHIKTMAEVYEYGLNIGHCGLTSRYFAVAFPEAQMACGALPILKGTKLYNGSHCWIVNNGFVLDSTLRLIIPEKVAAELGYKADRVLAHDSARTFSEYELYSNTLRARERDVRKYHDELLNIQ